MIMNSSVLLLAMAAGGVKLRFTMRFGCLKECRIQMNFVLETKRQNALLFPSNRFIVGFDFQFPIERFAPFMTTVSLPLSPQVSPR